MKPYEDWVDGSWTVDCVCGVNFDDGKEMVNCDECGVWVHTWCSRYAKGDDLFACHKCKIKNTRGFMYKEVPIEERVHVQGVPGGDLSMFDSFSSGFSRQLWKCSGYVPKKFRFQYREFPFRDDQEEDGSDGVLLCMLRDNCVAAATSDVIGVNDVKDGRSFGSREMEMNRCQSNDINKDKSLLCPFRRNERIEEEFEDRVKKKVKVTDKQEEDEDKNEI